MLGHQLPQNRFPAELGKAMVYEAHAKMTRQIWRIMAFKMKFKETMSEIQSRRGRIALAENLGGVLDPFLVWGIHNLQHHLQSSLPSLRKQIGYI